MGRQGMSGELELRHFEPLFETASRSEIRALQLERLRSVVSRTWETNPFYRDHWKAAGLRSADVTSLESFNRDFPAVRKADFIRDQEARPPFGRRAELALAERGPLMVVSTSGTSGQGAELHVQTRRERQSASQVAGHLYRWAGLEPGDGVFLCFPVTLLGGGRIELDGLEDYGLTVYPVGSYDVHRKLELMQRFKPQAIQATTSYLGHLAAASDGSPPSEGLKVVFGGGEGGGFSWFERLQEQWGVPVFNQYGATQTRVDTMYPCERGIGTRSLPGLIHNIDPYFLLEIVNPATGRHVTDGEAGEIVITSLIHSDTPLIRCAMGDGAVYHDASYCPCKRPFGGVEIGTITRLDDMVKVKGINLWPQSVEDVVFSFAEVDDFRAILSVDATQADVVTLQIMPERSIPQDGVEQFSAQLGGKLRDRIGIRFNIEVVPVGAFKRSEYKARRWIDQRARNT